MPHKRGITEGVLLREEGLVELMKREGIFEKGE